MIGAAGEAGNQPRVDGSGCGVARALDVLERPGQLGGCEVRIEDQAGGVTHTRLVPCLAQSSAFVRGAAVLPDDRRRDRLEGLAVPQDKGFPLIGDPDRTHVARAGVRSVER